MQALCIYAGPLARQSLERNGFQAADVGTIPGAAGGPKGLILGPLDRFIFGDLLAASRHDVHLVGASIGAWRMATACLHDPVAGFRRLEQDYIHQHYELPPGAKRLSAQMVSEKFGQSLQDFYGGRVAEVLQHSRYKLHIFTSRGRHLLGREHGVATPLGYLGAFITNSVRRKAMGAWLERVVFSSDAGPLPFATDDYRTRRVALTAANFMQALQASCSIPFVLKPVHNIEGAPPGAYWDGGITDYHLHLNYTKTTSVNQDAIDLVAVCACPEPIVAINSSKTGDVSVLSGGLVLYPHFQKAVVPGWLDKGLKWRHKSTHALDNVVLLAPNPDWVKTLPNGKLPDRTDFTHYGNDLAGRVKAWRTAASASQQLADEFAAWVARPDLRRVMAL
jgi:hypothetical protein